MAGASSTVAGTLVRMTSMPSRAKPAAIAAWSRDTVRLVSVIWQVRCLAILYLSITLPTATPIPSAPASFPPAP